MVNYPDLPGAMAQILRTLSHFPGGPNAVFGINFNPETQQWDYVTYHGLLQKLPKSKCSFCRFASTLYLGIFNRRLLCTCTLEMHEQYHFQPKRPGDFDEGNGKCMCNRDASLWSNSPCPRHPIGPCTELALQHGSTRSCKEVLEAYRRLMRYIIRPTRPLPKILYTIDIPAVLAMFHGIINLSDANMKELSAILCFDCAPNRAVLSYEDFRRNMIYRDYKSKSRQIFHMNRNEFLDSLNSKCVIEHPTSDSDLPFHFSQVDIDYLKTIANAFEEILELPQGYFTYDKNASYNDVQTPQCL